MSPKLNQEKSNRVRNLIGKDLVAALTILSEDLPVQGAEMLDDLTEAIEQLNEKKIDKARYSVKVQAIVDRIFDFLTTNTRKDDD